MKKGTIWMSAGLLLILAALFLTVYNVWDESRAGKAADEVVAQLEEEIPDEEEESGELADYQKYPDMEMPTKEIDGVRYIGTLEIPAFGLKLPIISEWSDSNAKIAPCRYAGSAYSKDIIIAGHNYRTHFAKIENLVGGDLIIFTDVEGNRFEYQVVEMEVLDGTAVEEMKSGDWDMTLFTCTYSGRTRMTIRCSLLK